MAPIKFEEDIREKLENRSVKPSENAWSKLSNRLDEQQEPKNNKPYWWLGLAASIIGVLLVASQFFNSKTHVEDLPELVETPEVIKQDSTRVIVKDVNKRLNELDEKKHVIKETSKAFIGVKKTDEAVAVSKREKAVDTEEHINKKPSSILKEKLSFEEQKIQDVVAQVQVLKEAQTVVTDADFDALLLQAQQEIRLNKFLNETTKMVDASALLQSVEYELDQSFREKVFKAIKASYNSVKTSVAQRNNK